MTTLLFAAADLLRPRLPDAHNVVSIPGILFIEIIHVFVLCIRLLNSDIIEELCSTTCHFLYSSKNYFNWQLGEIPLDPKFAEN